jgi:hypothetical protein
MLQGGFGDVDRIRDDWLPFQRLRLPDQLDELVAIAGSVMAPALFSDPNRRFESGQPLVGTYRDRLGTGGEDPMIWSQSSHL